MQKYVEFFVKIENETKNGTAIFVNFGHKKIWILTSEINCEELDRYGHAILHVPEWIVQRDNLKTED